MGRRGNASSKIRGYSACVLISPLLLYLIWSWNATRQSACDCDLLPGKYMWYAPHSGFSNQVGELRNALRIAAILGRTLLLPPVTDHHALSLGSCPKYRIAEPENLRAAAVAHFRDLLAQSRYYSITDVLNISSVSPGLVKTIDFRVFARFWCGQRASSSRLASSLMLDECRGKLTRATTSECSHCVRKVDDNCATTIWTYNTDVKPSTRGRALLSSSKLKLRKYEGSVRVRRDVYQSLGAGTEAGEAKLLAFGSLFSGEYQGAQTHVDLGAASGSENFYQVFRASEYLPLARVILEAGKVYVKQRVKEKAFFCTQLRLLDGQFKNHWKKTFESLRSRLASLGTDGSRTAIFVMTDLGLANWTGTYLEELSKDERFKLYVLDEKDELVVATVRSVLSSGSESQSPFVPQAREAGTEVAGAMLPDFLLYLQEAICSCASLGFHGTAGSTITESISQLRGAGSCS